MGQTLPCVSSLSLHELGQQARKARHVGHAAVCELLAAYTILPASPLASPPKIVSRRCTPCLLPHACRRVLVKCTQHPSSPAQVGGQGTVPAMGNCAAAPPKQKTKQVSPAYLSLSSRAGVCPRPQPLVGCTQESRLRSAAFLF